MKRTLMIFGYGRGISQAMAQRFGREGFTLALVARRGEVLEAAVKTLQEQGISAHAFIADLADAAAAAQVVREVRTRIGDLAVLHWNAFADVDGNLLDAPPHSLQESLNIRVVSYLAAIQEALPDLQAAHGAVLATSGITAFDQPQINAFAQELGVIAVSVAAQHKATALLALSLKARGVYVGEVIVNGFVHGTPGAEGQRGSVYPQDVAERFWQLYQARTPASCVLGGAV